MKLTRSSLPTFTGPADWFTGSVHVDGIRNPDAQSGISGGHVRFAPGARTAWHSHPHGQLLYVTDGEGRVATRDAVHVIRPGDSIFIEPGELHWHGAAPDRYMAHVAITEADDQGQVAAWGEQVNDEDYTRPAQEISRHD